MDEADKIMNCKMGLDQCTSVKDFNSSTCNDCDTYVVPDHIPEEQHFKFVTNDIRKYHENILP